MSKNPLVHALLVLGAIVALTGGCTDTPSKGKGKSSSSASAPGLTQTGGDSERPGLYSEATDGYLPATTEFVRSVTSPLMKTPMRIALGPDGTIAVSDPRAKSIFVFSRTGQLVERVALPHRPLGLAVDPLGRYIVGDADGSHVFILNSNGTQPRIFCAGAGEFSKSNDIAIDPSAGLVYIADSGHDRVVVCTTEGVFVRSFGTRGSLEGEFLFPVGVAADPVAGQVYVSDFNNGRVQVFDSFGIYKRTIARAASQFGGADGKLVRPAGLALDNLKRLYVGDLFQSQIQAFNPGGGYLQWIGRPGDREGRLLLPSDVTIDQYNRLIIVSQGTRRLEFIGLDNFSEPPAPGGVLSVTAELTQSFIQNGPTIAPSYLCLDVPDSPAGIVASSVRVDEAFAFDEAGIIATNVKCNGRYFEAQGRVALAQLWGIYPEGGDFDLPVTGRLRDGAEFVGTVHVSLVGGAQ